LLGVAFEVSGEAKERLDCEYRCAFTTGQISEVCCSGEPCEYGGIPIESFQIRVSAKSSVAQARYL